MISAPCQWCQPPAPIHDGRLSRNRRMSANLAWGRLAPALINSVTLH